MRFLPDGDSMKAADKDTIENLGIPSLELMERAARSCIDSMKKEKLDFTDVLIVCGSGNNGGDGFAIARLLKEEGCAVTVFMVWADQNVSVLICYIGKTTFIIKGYGELF